MRHPSNRITIYILGNIEMLRGEELVVEIVELCWKMWKLGMDSNFPIPWMDFQAGINQPLPPPIFTFYPMYKRNTFSFFPPFSFHSFTIFVSLFQFIFLLFIHSLFHSLFSFFLLSLAIFPLTFPFEVFLVFPEPLKAFGN